MAAKKSAAGKASAWDFPGASIVVVSLIFLAVAWPTVTFHGNGRWIGEALWVGIPGLIVASVVGVERWTSREQRKLKRLKDKRLRAEGKHPDQLRAAQLRREADERMLAAQRKHRAKIEAQEQQRQRVRAEIGREEERLRELGLLGGRRHRNG